MRSVSSPRAVSMITGMSERARRLRHSTRPSSPGQHQVEHDQSNAPGRERRHMARLRPRRWRESRSSPGNRPAGCGSRRRRRRSGCGRVDPWRYYSPRAGCGHPRKVTQHVKPARCRSARQKDPSLTFAAYMAALQYTQVAGTSFQPARAPGAQARFTELTGAIMKTTSKIIATVAAALALATAGAVLAQPGYGPGMGYGPGGGGMGYGPGMATDRAWAGGPGMGARHGPWPRYGRRRLRHPGRRRGAHGRLEGPVEDHLAAGSRVEDLREPP